MVDTDKYINIVEKDIKLFILAIEPYRIYVTFIKVIYQ